MSAEEHKLLGDVLLVVVIALFGLALPGYWLIRRKTPESGWNFGGNVTTVGLQGYDLLGVTVFVGFVTMMWKITGAHIGKVMPAITMAGAVQSAFMFLSIAAMIPAALFWRVRLMEFFGLQCVRARQALWVVPLFLILVYACAAVIESCGWRVWVEGLGGKTQTSVSTLAQTTDIKVIVALAFSAIIAAPVAEEVIFRGYVYPVVKRFTERNFAALFSAALFSVAHVNLIALPVLFFFGIMIVLVYEYTGSIWVPILCHMSFNALQIGGMLSMRVSENGGLSLIP